MKATYSAPKLTVHGNVADITQVLGPTERKDFAFLNGTAISSGNDIGSRDICRNGNPGVTPNGDPTKCDPNF